MIHSCRLKVPHDRLLVALLVDAKAYAYVPPREAVLNVLMVFIGRVMKPYGTSIVVLVPLRPHRCCKPMSFYAKAGPTSVVIRYKSKTSMSLSCLTPNTKSPYLIAHQSYTWRHMHFACGVRRHGETFDWRLRCLLAQYSKLRLKTKINLRLNVSISVCAYS